MAALEQVMQLKNQGYNEDQIVESLKQQGVSPKEITDAINQSNIKDAVSGESKNYDAPQAPEQNQENSKFQRPGNQPQGQDTGYSPSTQEISSPQQTNTQEQSQQQTYDQNYGQNYNQEQYDQNYGYQENQGTSGNSETMIEIADQVFSEKIKDIQNTIDDLNEFKTTTETKVEHIDKRLKKIEKMIDTLQIKVLEKVGNYGKELSSTKKELKMVEDSISKINKKSSKSKKKKSKKKSKK